MHRLSVLMASAALLATGFTQAADLTVAAGQTYTVGPAQSDLRLDHLTLGDNARVTFAPGVSSWRVYAKQASIGQNVMIDGRGADGAIGSVGAERSGRAKACEEGRAGGNGSVGASRRQRGEHVVMVGRGNTGQPQYPGQAVVLAGLEALAGVVRTVAPQTIARAAKVALAVMAALAAVVAKVEISHWHISPVRKSALSANAFVSAHWGGVPVPEARVALAVVRRKASFNGRQAVAIAGLKAANGVERCRGHYRQSRRRRGDTS